MPHSSSVTRPPASYTERLGPPGARGVTDIDRFIGARIRQRRATEQLSQEKLAELIGVTFQQIQKYEKGINRVSAATLYRIAQELRVPISDLLPTDDSSAGGGVDLPTVRALVTLASGLNAEGRALLLNLARTLLKCDGLRPQGPRGQRL